MQMNALQVWQDREAITRERAKREQLLGQVFTYFDVRYDDQTMQQWLDPSLLQMLRREGVRMGYLINPDRGELNGPWNQGYTAKQRSDYHGFFITLGGMAKPAAEGTRGGGDDQLGWYTFKALVLDTESGWWADHEQLFARQLAMKAEREQEFAGDVLTAGEVDAVFVESDRYE